MSDIIRWPFGFLMDLFYGWTGGYVWSLLLFAILMKLVTIPFSIKQQKTQIRNALLRPKMAAIEKKYAGRTDQKTLQKKQQEIQELQQKEGVSPFSGCLPMIIQLVIVIILYGVVQRPITYICDFGNGVNFAANSEIASTIREAMISLTADLPTKITDKSSELQVLQTFRDMYASGATIPESIAKYAEQLTSLNFNLFGMDLSHTPPSPFKGDFSWLLLIPVLVGVSSWGSMKFSRKLMGNSPAQDAAPEMRTSTIMMDITMPLMSVFFSFQLSAALGVYWIYQSLLGMLQQFILAMAMPLPKFTEEELREIQKAEKARAEASRAALRGENRPAGTSLHFSDDDDEDVDIPVIRSKFDDEEYTPAPKSTSTPSGGATRNNQRKKKK